MAAFEFTALDPSGRERKGVLEGDTPRQVRQQLREQGLAPLAVAEVRSSEKHRAASRLSFQRGISATDLALITRQFATLVRSGLPIEEALQVVSRQTEKPRLRNMLMGVRARVMEGHTLATALRDFPHIFSDLYSATVSAGEQSGHLEVVLERLADYTETRQALRQKIMLALIYPVVVTGVAILVVTALLAFVVPQVVQVFENTGQQLPILTRMLIAVSSFIRDYGVLLLVILAVLGVMAASLLRRPGPKLRFHQLLLSLPLIARLVRSMNTARFMRTFSILTASGVPVIEAMRISAQVMSNLVMRAAVEEASRRVREGANLHKSLERSGYFPPIAIHLVASGETSGKLEQMLDRAAVSQEREIETLLAAILGLFEPLLILGMGGMVLVIVLAILLPIFDLNQLVK
ncbi:MAG: type II secretion system inner membrane protein GspF [Gammaproteobacteria bacterium]|nr:type II secretion system inner membrane protein GspF [Gammaproteobacteria bacterium]